MVSDKQTVHFSPNEDNSEVTPKHDARVYTPPNAEASLADNNVYLVTTLDLKAAVNERMWGTIEEYNAKQKRADRKMSHDEYTRLLNGGKNTQPIKEFVVGIGNHETCGITDNTFDGKHWEKLKQEGKLDEAAAYVQEHLNDDPRLDDAKQVLINFAERFSERFPNFEIVGAYIHADEPNSGLHMHLQVIPMSTNAHAGGYKRGTKEQISYTGACQDAGFFTHTERRYDPKTHKVRNMRINEWMGFEEAARAYLAEDAAEFGFEHDFKGGGKKRQNIHAFKAEREEQEAKERAEQAEKRAAEATARAEHASEVLMTYTEFVDATTEQLEATKAEVKEKETAVAAKEAAADTKLADADAKLAEADEKHAAAQEMVATLDEREEAVSTREQEVEQAKLRADEESRVKKEMTDEYVKERIAEANAVAAKASTERAAELDAREEAIAEAEARIQEKYEEREKELEAREQAVKDGEELLRKRKRKADEDEEEMKSLATRLRSSLADTDKMRRSIEAALMSDARMRLLVQGVRAMFAAMRSTPMTIPGVPKEDANLATRVHLAAHDYDERMAKRNGKPLPKADSAANAFYDLSNVAEAAKEAKKKDVQEKQAEEARRAIADAEKYLHIEDSMEMGE